MARRWPITKPCLFQFSTNEKRCVVWQTILAMSWRWLGFFRKGKDRVWKCMPWVQKTLKWELHNNTSFQTLVSEVMMMTAMTLTLALDHFGLVSPGLRVRNKTRPFLILCDVTCCYALPSTGRRWWVSEWVRYFYFRLMSIVTNYSILLGLGTIDPANNGLAGDDFLNLISSLCCYC